MYKGMQCRTLSDLIAFFVELLVNHVNGKGRHILSHMFTLASIIQTTSPLASGGSAASL